jgi:hypothetical protein
MGVPYVGVIHIGGIMHTSLAVNFRPIKTLYFLDSNDLATFVDVALYCCTQWGGMYNFIVPVSPDGVLDMFLDAIRMHAPDRAVSACVANDQIVADLRHEYFPRLSPRGWDYFKEADAAAHPLRLYPARRGEKPDLHLYTVPETEGDISRACAIAAFGGIWPGQEDGIAERFQIVQREVSPFELAFVESQLDTDTLASPVNLTGTAIEAHLVKGAHMTAHFEVVMANSVIDLSWFWTRRAVDSITQGPVNDYVRKTLIVPLESLETDIARRNLVTTVRHGLSLNPDLTSSWDINVTHFAGEGRLADILSSFSDERLLRPLANGEELGTTHRYAAGETQQVPDRIAHGEPLIYTRNLYFPLSGPYFEGLTHPPARPHIFEDGENRILAPPPSREFDYSLQLVRMDFESEVWQRFPQTGSVERHIHPSGEFTDYGLSIYLAPVNRETPWTLNLPSPFEVLRLHFAESGYEIRRGTAGQQGQAVLAFTGGLSQLDRAHIFRRRPIARLFQAMTTKSAYERFHDAAEEFRRRLADIELAETTHSNLVSAVAELEAAADRNLVAVRRPSTLKQINGRVFEQDDIKRLQKKPNMVKVVDELVRLKLLVRGFLLQCENCTTATWHPLDQVGEDVVCPGCAMMTHLSVHVTGGERPWEYLLNATVNRAVDHGALAPILLIVAAAQQRNPIYSPELGVDLYVAGREERVGDFDIAFVYKQRVYVGEAKMGQELKGKDIQLARLAFELGCGGFYFASLEGFNEEATRRIEALREELNPMPRGSQFEIVTWGPNELLTDDS